MTQEHSSVTGEAMYELIRRLFPICRSITGNGVRQTLRVLQEQLPLSIHEVPSGTRVFDWTIPNEWNIRDGYVVDPEGRRLLEFKKNNLHVVGYSVPVDVELSLEELQSHLYSLERQPDAIPYVTSYYQERWGFCISHRERERLRPGRYRAVIDSELRPGSLTYADLLLPGTSPKEVLLSTYVCHPSMANNELSGPAVMTALAQWLMASPRRYSYRLLFIPERIGSITYLSRHLDELKKNTIAGFNISCVGDDRAYSYLPSRYGNTLTDRVALAVLAAKHPEFVRYSYLDRGSDENQYCAAGVDLPVVSLMRTKYASYPEYHTSLDDLTVVSPKGLLGAFELYCDCITLLEQNATYKMKCLLEPQLGKRGLFPTLWSKDTVNKFVETMIHFIAYADGSNDLVELSRILNVGPWELYTVVEKLKAADLLEEVAPLVP